MAVARITPSETELCNTIYRVFLTDPFLVREIPDIKHRAINQLEKVGCVDLLRKGFQHQGKDYFPAIYRLSKTGIECAKRWDE